MHFLDKYQDRMLSVLRIMAGLLLLQFGMAKVLRLPFVEMFANIPLGSWPYGIAGILELVLGILIVLGLFSRFAAFIASGEMAFAFFLGHVLPKGTIIPILNDGSLSVLFCFVFLYIASAGPGRWALNRD